MIEELRIFLFINYFTFGNERYNPPRERIIPNQRWNESYKGTIFIVIFHLKKLNKKGIDDWHGFINRKIIRFTIFKKVIYFCSTILYILYFKIYY